MRCSTPAPEVSSGGISLSNKGLCLRRKEGAVRDEVMRDRVREKLEPCLHAESPVQLRQMCLDGDRSDVEFSSDVLVAEAFFEKFENRALGGAHQIDSHRPRFHERDGFARGPDMSALHDSQGLEQVR